MANIKSIIGFRPLPVTLLTIFTYISLFAALIWIDRRPPKVASQRELDHWGVDVHEAYQDLQFLTRSFHPYNSRKNDDIRQYLLDRLQQILSVNGVKGFADSESVDSKDRYDGTVQLINDGVGSTWGSNVTYYNPLNRNTVYFEGTNIIVYIHGERPTSELSPVLVNAHYDSVSTGYGATDDGVAIVSVLQVIKSFTRSEANGGKRPQRGLIALLNNGEEDGLNGARAFAMHPIAQLPHMFLNLEGAGAGGRATLFRSNDSAVTRFYQKAKRPFGSAVSGDGYKMGAVRSYTDYTVFRDSLGMRGLDVAFYEPRSRYHTTDDDTRHTSRRSIWHMLSLSLYTLRAMVDDTGSEFDQNGGAGKGKPGTWFDLFGRTFAVFDVETLFSWTITLIVIPFFAIAGGLYILNRTQKLYFFSNASLHPPPPDIAHVAKTIRGWRGLFRLPVAFVLASAATMGMALWIHKVNPMIVYSSPDSVWANLLATWWTIAWVILRGADAVRPTALARGYACLQLFIFWLLIMVAVAYISSPKVGLSSGYWVPVFYMGAFVASCISLYELSTLQRKDEVEGLSGAEALAYSSEGHSQAAVSSDGSSHPDGEDDDENSQATETTPLFRGPNRPSSFAYNRNIRHETASSDTEPKDDDIYGKEQNWSKYLPDWAWIPQFLIAVPIQLMFAGPIGLVLTAGVAQTGGDGGSTTLPYLIIAAFSIILLLPITPFLHRVTYHVTLFLFVVLIGTSIYNLAAFPFSPDARLKLYFQQSVDLQTGENLVHLVGHPNFTESIVSNFIPSATKENIKCAPETESTRHSGLVRCSWKGPSPKIAPIVPGAAANGMAGWVSYNITKLGDGKALISLAGKNTRACKLLFDSKNVTDIEVRNGHGSQPANGNLSQSLMHYTKTPVEKMPRSPTLGDPIPESGSNELRLWSRQWEHGWDVELTWEQEATIFPTTLDGHGPDSMVHTELKAAKRTAHNDNKADNNSKGGLEGRVVCLWSDANRDADDIPAFEEVRKYLPVWAVATKLADGLVEASVPFMI